MQHRMNCTCIVGPGSACQSPPGQTRWRRRSHGALLSPQPAEEIQPCFSLGCVEPLEVDRRSLDLIIRAGVGYVNLKLLSWSGPARPDNEPLPPCWLSWVATYWSQNKTCSECCYTEPPSSELKSSSRGLTGWAVKQRMPSSNVLCLCPVIKNHTLSF